MTLTGRQKKMIAMLAFSVVSFFVDQMFFGPSKVDAGSSLLLARPGGGEVGQAGAGATTQRSAASLQWGARGVQARLVAATRPFATSLVETRDIFHPMGLAKPATEKAPTDMAARTVVKESAPDPVVVFLSKHSLRAVMSAGKGGCAMVDDRLVRVGELLDGHRLIALERRAAIFEVNSVRVRLTLSDAKSDSDHSSK